VASSSEHRLELTAIDNATRVLQGVGKAAADLGKTYDDLADKMRALGGVLGIGAFAAMIKGSIDAADHLNDLHKSTGVMVEDLAGLRLLAKQSGTDLDALAKGINRMSVEMGKSPEKFAALGVTAKDNLKAFQQLADIFNLLPDIQQRNALAQSIFQKSWAEMAPALSEGGQKIGEVVERGAKLAGVTKEIAEQADALNDKWVELVGTGGAMMRLVGPMLPLLNEIADAMLKMQERSSSLGASFSPLAEILKTLVVLAANVGFVFDTMGRDIARAIENVKLIASGDFAGSRALGEQFSAAAAGRRAELDSFSARIMNLGLTGKPAASGPGADPAAQAAASAAAAGFLGNGKAGGGDPAEAERIRQLLAVYELMKEAWKEGEAIRTAEAKAAEAQRLADEKLRQQYENEAEALRKLIDPTRQYVQAIAEAQVLMERGVITQDELTAATLKYQEAINRVLDKDLPKSVDKTNDLVKDMGITFTSAFEKAVVGGQKLSTVLKSLAQDILAIMLRQAITIPMGNALGGLLGGGGGLGGLAGMFNIGGMFGPALGGGGGATAGLAMPFMPMGFASGGDFSGGQPMMVGEQGPELMVPRGSGTVIPNHALGGGSLTVNIDATGADAAGLRRVESAVMALHNSFDGRAVGAIQKAYNRRGFSTPLG
jgi:hypothetical protein